MLYIYDVLLNFNSDNKIYDFYDWDLNDNIEHIKRIPLFRIKSDILSNISNSIFRIDKSFLFRVKNCSEVYRNKKIEKLMYAALFTDGNRALAVEFNHQGLSVHKSILLLDEEEEVIDLAHKINEIDLSLKIDKTLDNNKFLTRNDEYIMNFLKKEILDTYKKKDIDKLRYLYMEYFGKISDDAHRIYVNLINTLKKGINEKHNTMYNLLKLSYTGK